MTARLGPHIIRPTDQAMTQAARSNIVFAIDDPKPLTVAPAGAFTIFRKFYPVQDVSRNGADLAYEILAACNGYLPSAIVLYVECAQRLGAGLERYVEQHREAQTYLRQHYPAVKLIGYNFSTGQPEQDAIQYVQQHGWFCDYLGLHEYWAKAGFSEWFANRHALVHQWTSGNHPPIVMTECGRDAVQGEGGEGIPGWKNQGISGADYAREVRAYANQLPSYVFGAVVFTAGPTPDWEHFSVDELSIDYTKGTEQLMPVQQPEYGNEFDLSPHFNERPAPRIEGIVIHSTEGAFESTRDWFKRPVSQVSSHYVLRKDGYLLQMVLEAKRAWHAGTKATDKTGLWGNADFNGISIGIELEGYAGQPFTTIQYTILVMLCRYLADKYQIPWDRAHIVAHSELSKAKGDPGAKFEWDRLMEPISEPLPVIDWQARATELQAQLTAANAKLESVRGIVNA